jgi:hypothetical protein
MHTRRLATLLLGAWLAGSLFMTWVAIGNFQSVESVLKSQSAKVQREINDIGLARSRALLRHHASEQNRHYFYNWEITELVLAVVLLLVVLFATNGNKFILGLSAWMLLLTVVMHFAITPQVTEIGRALDFTSIDEMPAERAVFWNYHKSYSTLAVVKIISGIVLGVRLLYNTSQLRRRSSDSRKKVKTVDDADHSHING